MVGSGSSKQSKLSKFSEPKIEETPPQSTASSNAKNQIQNWNYIAGGAGGVSGELLC